jgi:hypothetical protein
MPSPNKLIKLESCIWQSEPPTRRRTAQQRKSQRPRVRDYECLIGYDVTLNVGPLDGSNDVARMSKALVGVNGFVRLYFSSL